MSTKQKITPYYEYDLLDVRERYCMWRNAIKKRNRDDIVAYSIKANYDPEIIDILNREGAYFEVCSRYEYMYLLDHNVLPKRIIHNGSIRDYQELKNMLDNQSIVFLDSDQAVSFALQYNAKGKIGIRCNVDYLKTNSDMFYSKRSRFGIRNISDVCSLFGKNTPLTISYLQIHCAGNNRSPAVYAMLLRELCSISKNIAKYNQINCLDIGGGYKIAEEYWDEETYIKTVTNILEENNMQNCQLIFEPGNALVRGSAQYVTRIVDRKVIDNTVYLVVDGTVVHLPFYKRGINLEYTVKTQGKKKIKSQIVVGSTCKESDVFFVIDNGIELQVGDEIAIKNVGAYAINEISDFLVGRPNIYYD